MEVADQSLIHFSWQSWCNALEMAAEIIAKLTGLYLQQERHTHLGEGFVVATCQSIINNLDLAAFMSGLMDNVQVPLPIDSLTVRRKKGV
jgi:hypothetical protein